MKKQYHAIPVLIYVPVDAYPDALDVYDAIRTPLHMEAPDLTVFMAEDYHDGLIEIDLDEKEFSGAIKFDCLPR